mgnify:CR=1 FL=1
MDTPALFPDYHDYDRRERLLTAMVKDFPPGHYTGRHEHPSGQLIYDVHGVMVADTDMGRWVVPPTRWWLWMPPSVHHGLRMVGERHAPAAGRAAASLGRHASGPVRLTRRHKRNLGGPAVGLSLAAGCRVSACRRSSSRASIERSCVGFVFTSEAQPLVTPLA